MTEAVLSEAQRRMLVSARDFGNPMIHLRGRSEMGGAQRTMQALRRLNFMNEDWHITPAGRAALNQTEARLPAVKGEL